MTDTLPRTISFAIRGPLERADLPSLYERFCAAVTASQPELVLCDVGGVRADAVAVDALARMQLAARRNGCTVRLCNASAPLRELVAFMGLRDVLLE
ncbi:STAS domain-containing protein [Conexibacter arvalis]|uniref:ABC-type transporter Mla MlaB component n=1 Tax=Conexibacter arvalis TaxID=912552 RepID=A0A840IFS2_9ACTN|nr:STAS domain-containing protein [Conexibacter arvalis]MBB4663857.1 ABC-type transporter Mla MlaB component [Conexibacter arvalis]